MTFLGQLTNLHPPGILWCSEKKPSELCHSVWYMCAFQQKWYFQLRTKNPVRKRHTHWYCCMFSMLPNGQKWTMMSSHLTDIFLDTPASLIVFNSFNGEVSFATRKRMNSRTVCIKKKLVKCSLFSKMWRLPWSSGLLCKWQGWEIYSVFLREAG